MQHRWESIAFLHWSYPVDEVQRHLPRGLEVEPWDGAAWVGLIPFRMRLGGPAGPRLLVFPETNVRTYVVGPDGRPGVWFFSLDAASLSAVTAARSTWRLPYFWSSMSAHGEGARMRYTSRRRRPRPAGVGHDITVEIGEPLAEPSEFDHYLTARFTLWNSIARRVVSTQADHPPWDLHGARVIECREDLVAAAGLTPPAGEPVVHWSPGVDVRIGRPRMMRGR